MTNERETKQSHYSISLVTIEILILGKYSSVCTATDYEKGSCERIFEMPDILVLRLTFRQHTILPFNQLTSNSCESLENHRFSEHFLRIEVI